MSFQTLKIFVHVQNTNEDIFDEIPSRAFWPSTDSNVTTIFEKCVHAERKNHWLRSGDTHIIIVFLCAQSILIASQNRSWATDFQLVI